MANLSYIRHHLLRDPPSSNHHRSHRNQDPYFPFTIDLERPPNDIVVSDPAGGDSSPVINRRENQVTFVMDLFQDRVDHPLDSFVDSGFGVVVDEEDDFGDEIGGVAIDDSDLGLGLGLGGNFRYDENNDDGRSVVGLGVGDDGDAGDADEFFVEASRVFDGVESCEAESTVSVLTGGVRIVGFGSDLDLDEEGNDYEGEDAFGVDEYGLGDLNLGNRSYEMDLDGDGDGDDVSIPLCWDSLQLEEDEERGDRGNGNEEFEWEEVDGRVYERDVLSVLAGDVGEEEEEEEVGEDGGSIPFSVTPIIAPEDLVSVEQGGEFGSLDWEVLLNANVLESNPDREISLETYINGGGDHEDFYVNAVEYDTLFGQFAENETTMMGRPPAAQSVVLNLQSVVVTNEDVKEGGNVVCAVCKDDMSVGESAKQLPCSHRYHGECIVPWLGIRNTCPVCRYELPTDDTDYERSKALQRVVVLGDAGRLP